MGRADDKDTYGKHLVACNDIPEAIKQLARNRLIHNEAIIAFAIHRLRNRGCANSRINWEYREQVQFSSASSKYTTATWERSSSHPRNACHNIALEVLPKTLPEAHAAFKEAMAPQLSQSASSLHVPEPVQKFKKLPRRAEPPEPKYAVESS